MNSIMTKKSEDKKADFVAVADRGETVSLMEPLLITESSAPSTARQTAEPTEKRR
jgi:hypothetical protein